MGVRGSAGEACAAWVCFRREKASSGAATRTRPEHCRSRGRRWRKEGRRLRPGGRVLSRFRPPCCVYDFDAPKEPPQSAPAQPGSRAEGQHDRSKRFTEGVAAPGSSGKAVGNETGRPRCGRRGVANGERWSAISPYQRRERPPRTRYRSCLKPAVDLGRDQDPDARRGARQNHRRKRAARYTPGA